jgi:hypothetical protein
MTRNGKIARLPREIRDELNRRMADGENGGSLLRWLNVLPAVQAVLSREFGGKPVIKQNLSEWRGGGFAEWQSRQEMLAQTRELVEDANELTTVTNGKLTDYLATVLAARYAAAMASWSGEVSDDFRRKLRVLHGLCQDVVELRRGDHSGARLALEQERVGRERDKTTEQVFEQFQKWAKNPSVRDIINENEVSLEERVRRMRELFGLAPKEPDKSPDDPAESNQVKPGQTTFSQPMNSNGS